MERIAAINNAVHGAMLRFMTDFRFHPNGSFAVAGAIVTYQPRVPLIHRKTEPWANGLNRQAAETQAASSTVMLIDDEANTARHVGRLLLFCEESRKGNASVTDFLHVKPEHSMKPSENAAAIDEYIAAFSADTGKVLQKVRQTIRKAAPAAKERMSYNMPAFFLDGVIVHFGAFKEHIGLYPPVRARELQARIAPYRGEKGNLAFPLDKPVPYDLIADIVKSRLASRGRKGSKQK